MTWVSLQSHSQYSILDSSSSLKALAARAAEFGMPALALTDHGNLFGAVEFYKACRSAGLKALIGCELYVAPKERGLKERVPGKRHGYSMVLLAKNGEGYHNLCKLSSMGYLEGFYYYPRVDKAALEAHSEGLICITGHIGSLLGDLLLEESDETVEGEVNWLREVFREDLFFSLQRHGMSDEDYEQDGMHDESWLERKYQDFIDRQDQVNKKLIDLGKKQGIALVATNDSHYMDRQDWRAHEILLNVQSGEPCEIWERDSFGNPKFRVANPKRKVYPSHEFYFKSPQQMEELFADCPEAVANTVKVAEACQVDIDFETKHYPVYIPPHLQGKPYTPDEQKKAAEAYLWELCQKGIEKRYTPERLEKVANEYPGKDPLKVVHDRLEMEMSIIAPKGMCDYLLIVWDFINWAKEQGIPVGPGRGSGAGAIVNYLIGITDIEPLRFNLFFERFINPERISYPDIDVDICMDRRADVIEYTLNKYGQENVAQIVTFGTMKAKMAIKDVGRVLSVPLAKVNAIAKLVPEELGITIEKALELDPDLNSLYNSDEEAQRIIDLARKLEGSIRNTGIHAAGVIICGEPLTEHIPVFRPKDAELIATQFSMKPVEAVGMLKVDFLGLKTLTGIQHCVEAIKEHEGREIDWINLPLDDANTFNLLNQGKTLGVFQLESGGMQDLARKLRLDKFEEIIAVSALYRPGPMDMIPSFIARKHGEEEIEYDHEWMRDILDETYGIMVYQEQVMQIAQKLANYSLGEGDVLRRAMGKKDHDEMERQRAKFGEGAVSNGLSFELAMSIFDKMEKFASYGFNKSHAAAYGYIAYVTAFLKSNYPGQWMAALMTCDRDDITKVAKFIRECQAMEIPMLPPDVNEAGDTFVAAPSGIRFAMSGIKGVGQGVVQAILTERKANGVFKNFYDFFKRIDTKKVGKKVIELLVQAGSFDFTGWSRDQMQESVGEMFEAAAREQKDQSTGMMSFFSLMDEGEDKRFVDPPEVKKKRSQIEILLKEKELLGFFLTGHPLEIYGSVLQRLSCVAMNKLKELDQDAVVRLAFVVETVQVRISQRTQKKFAILEISDGLERFELPIWADLFEEKGHLLRENQLLYAVLQVDRRDGGLRLSCRWFDDLTQVDDKMVEACDQAYDRAKLQAQRQALAKLRKEANPPKGEKGLPEKENHVLKVLMDGLSARLSHILRVKQILRENPGPVPLRIGFQVNDQVAAVLHLDEEKGLFTKGDTLSQLSAIESVLSAKLVGEGKEKKGK